MANINSSKKDKIKSIYRRLNNVSNKSKIKTFFKKVKFSLEKKDLNNCLTHFKSFQSIVDRCANKGIIHKNRAKKYKSNLVKYIKNIQLKN
ncbi:30S ribosomal protein S20 [Buchnera aphidicola (Chaitoregma tattakana)]|uniref:30S ribosomal protein S20 n=1 Tax=Buchnera aphidicola TaxID=9 RepID=UPI0031B85190